MGSHMRGVTPAVLVFNAKPTENGVGSFHHQYI
jgi:hypothetical protein